MAAVTSLKIAFFSFPFPGL